MHRKLLVFGVLLIGLSLAFSFNLVLAGHSPLIADPLSPQVVPIDQLIKVTTGDVGSLDPAWDYETAGNEIIQQIYDPLIAFNREKTDEFIPMLATDWTISAQSDVFTFTIRQGVEFHNGSSLTPEDVAYTFQRAILQGGTSTPQWLFTEPILGTGITDICYLLDESVCDSRDALIALQDSNPALVASACQSIKSAITFDEDMSQVTFHLAKPWGPFLNTLVGSWGSITDKEWSVEQGAWDGSCATWHNFYDPDAGEVPLDTVANGTGPFKLDHWNVGEELVLTRNDNYWRTEPMWEGGPTGPTMFTSYSRIINDVGAARADMLLNGDSDLVTFDSADYDRLYDEVIFAYDDPAGVEPTLINPDGKLKLFRGGLSTTALDVFFTYNIHSAGSINYIGSGTLDGAGIPPDFFTDIHVRKAFNYAFDWDEYNTLIFGGTGVQRTGPVISGLAGFDASQPKYTYSPTLALQEFNQAWGGQVAANGFTLVLAYNTGNSQRQAVLGILKDNIEALDPDFNVNVVELGWVTYTDDLYAHRLPLFVAGWSQDLAHPHNWVVPYLNGVYADRQELPSNIQNEYETKINACVELFGVEAETCYEDIQTSTYDDALDIFLEQGILRHFIRAEVQGYYISQALVICSTSTIDQR